MLEKVDKSSLSVEGVNVFPLEIVSKPLCDVWRAADGDGPRRSSDTKLLRASPFAAVNPSVAHIRLVVHALVLAFINCRVDYCNAVFDGASGGVIKRLYMVHSCCCVTSQWHQCHMTLILRDDLQWLPLQPRITYVRSHWWRSTVTCARNLSGLFQRHLLRRQSWITLQDFAPLPAVTCWFQLENKTCRTAQLHYLRPYQLKHLSDSAVMKFYANSEQFVRGF